MGKRPLATLLVLASLSACGSSSKPAARSEPAASSSAAKGASEHETAAQRRVRRGLARREQCRELGSEIEDAQRQDIIINVNDTAALQSIAGELDRSSADIDAVEIGDEGLARLRKEYVDNTREMSKQLGAMATAKSEGARRAASGKFSACQDKIGVYIQKLNEYCNAPVK